MTIVDSAKHEDRSVRRRCDVCGEVIRVDCYPRTGENQTKARNESEVKLKEHLSRHSFEELYIYIRRIHQVG